MGWINSMMSLVSSDELATDVTGAEALLERHQEHWTEMDARTGAFQSLHRCTSLLPSLKRAEVVREWVGLRPYRDPVRCGNAEVVQQGSQRMTVLPQYGHGGYGVTTSPGSAIHATKAVKEIIRSGRVENSHSTASIMIVSKI
ncbi:unnamed protein product [Orchesella dallaii]|uniref:FAD dependent oxidoreductase domain-containing protein n=1 Tax=Orchesella dallaii TaxID=48710 RepID=A0ABP1RVT3_9HEXA